jgi:acetyl-CoA carboxylase biotin carboxyl carrier protein
MDIEQIRQLIDLMVENELTQLEIRDGENRVSLRRGCADSQVMTAWPAGMAMPAPAAPPAAAPAASAASSGATAASATAEESTLVHIKSPMVGTFYVAPAPDEPPFVNVGTHVTEDTVVCIIAAMKVMNEIKAECRGTIVHVLAKNEEAVEYDQPLFQVRPD